MKDFFKPVTLAGFFTTALVALPNAAQDYIDVEAEREAAERAAVGSAPSDTGTATPAGYTVSGVTPYAGQTVTAVPITTNQGVSSANPNVGSLVVQLQQLQEEVRRLNGVVEQQSAEINRLKEQSLERYVDLDRRIADLAKGSAVASPTVVDTTGEEGLTFGGTPKTDPPQPLQPGEESAYQSAYGYVKSKNFSEAVEGFKKFLQNYPYGRYAPNAHYWLGELYLVIDPTEPELARQSFQLLLDQYPNNAKIPDALYKLGKVHLLKGNSERSREYLDRVIAEYPGHPASQLATDFLSENF